MAAALSWRAVAWLGFVPGWATVFGQAGHCRWPGMWSEPTGPAATDRTVDHGAPDITAQMRAVIAAPLAAALTDRRLPGLRRLDDAAATGAGLLAALHAARQPSSRHPATAGLDPWTTRAAMHDNLGLPVDVGHVPLELDAIDDAMPPGCVWFSQACCSAGSNATTSYAGLLAPGTSAFGVVSAVAALGSTVAPAALRMLGRPAPVRAVIGHVEPTFDWTLRVPETGQGLGHDLVAALSSNAFTGQPLGLAFTDYRSGVGELHSEWATLRSALDAGDMTVRPALTRLRLTAMDRQSLVLLGDPTVTLPPLPN